MSKSEDHENEEGDTSRNESQSFDWLELLASEPVANRDQAPESDEDMAEESPLAAPETNDMVAERSGYNTRAAAGDDQDLAAAPDPWLTDPKEPDTTAADLDSGGHAGEAFESDAITQEPDDLGNQIDLEDDELMWLDDMETVPEMNANPLEDNDKQAQESFDDSTARQAEAGGQGEVVDLEPVRVDSDQVPDDPDEAIAWLERLAAKQGAPSEELPTVQSSVSLPVDEITPAGPTAGFSDEEAGEIPEDPDEAMVWLERLAARQGADSDELMTVEETTEVVEPDASHEMETEEVDEPQLSALSEELDEALGWLEELTSPQEPEEEAAEALPPVEVVEEPPTPAVSHNVDSSLEGADLLFVEPEGVAPAEVHDEPVDESQIEDADDAMAWLEQLAARQGAPIEELTALDSPADVDLVSTEAAVEMDDHLDSQAILGAGEAEQDAPLQEVPIADETSEELHEEQEPVTVAEVAAAAEIVAADEEPETDPSAMEPTPEETEEDSLAPEPAAEADVPTEDLAWLDTLGSVDADSWLEGEAIDERFEPVSELAEESEVETVSEIEDRLPGTSTLPGILPDAPGSEELTMARQAMKEGAVDRGLATYSVLVEKGEFLPFLIDDLETVSEEQGPEPGLQRVLGDAYARNGQLQKALQAYREALDNL